MGFMGRTLAILQNMGMHSQRFQGPMIEPMGSTGGRTYHVPNYATRYAHPGVMKWFMLRTGP